MCTVSFYRKNSKVIITSNRDEQLNRPLATEPQKYVYKNTTLYFPRDPKAGGTWFVVKSNGSTLVLLNGAEKKHISNPPYRLSRGIILLELAISNHLTDTWNLINLNEIEPFTIIVYESNNLIQLRWNGNKKKYKLLDVYLPHIWSSSTLYEPEIIKQREFWFDDFLKLKNDFINEDDLINFHTKTQSNDNINGLVINRNQNMLTKNVTQVVLGNNQFALTHYDMITQKITKIEQEVYETLVL